MDDSKIHDLVDSTIASWPAEYAAQVPGVLEADSDTRAARMRELAPSVANIQEAQSARQERNQRARDAKAMPVMRERARILNEQARFNRGERGPLYGLDLDMPPLPDGWTDERYRRAMPDKATSEHEGLPSAYAM